MTTKTKSERITATKPFIGITAKSERITITKPFMGITAMQVCAGEDCTDEEILEHCNIHNLCGTTKGWCEVVRKITKNHPANMQPGICEDNPHRKHFIVIC